MMKKRYYFLLLATPLFSCSHQAAAQQLVRSVSGTAGIANKAAGTMQADWTAGESVIGAFANGTGLFTQGFQQGTMPISTLSVRMADITAVNEGAYNRVSWSTASEDRGDAFLIERSSDGIAFAVFGKQNAKGEAASYRFIDTNPFIGINYYRIKLLNTSGSNSYSKVVSAVVQLGGNSLVSVHPNPATDLATVNIAGPIPAGASLKLIDGIGREVKVYPVNAPVTVMDLTAQASGVYLLKYTADDHSQVIRIYKD